MQLTSQQVLPVSQTIAWEALNDMSILQACIPGCESMEKVSDSEFHLVMGAKVGPVNAKFKGRITLADIDPPNAYTLTFEGQGGVAGFAKGEAVVRLAPEGEATRLAYTAKANVGGKIAQVGSRLIDGVARKMAENFFSAFNRHVTGFLATVDAGRWLRRDRRSISTSATGVTDDRS